MRRGALLIASPLATVASAEGRLVVKRTNPQTFREIRDGNFTKDFPASTLVQVVRLARPELLIEIEAVAVVE